MSGDWVVVINEGMTDCHARHRDSDSDRDRDRDRDLNQNVRASMKIKGTAG